MLTRPSRMMLAFCKVCVAPIMASTASRCPFLNLDNELVRRRKANHTVMVSNWAVARGDAYVRVRAEGEVAIQADVSSVCLRACRPPPLGKAFRTRQSLDLHMDIKRSR